MKNKTDRLVRLSSYLIMLVVFILSLAVMVLRYWLGFGYAAYYRSDNALRYPFPKKHFQTFLDHMEIGEDTFWDVVDSWRSDHLWRGKGNDWALRKPIWEVDET